MVVAASTAIIGGAEAQAQGCDTITDAIYSWWVEPVAVSDGPYTWVGSIDSTGVNHVTRLDCITGTSAGVPLGSGEVDDHNPAAVALAPHRSDLLVFYAEHDEDPVIRWRTIDRSTLAASVEHELNFGGTTPVTYAQPLVYGDRVVLLTRQGESWVYMISDDWGGSWTPPRTLVDSGDEGQCYITSQADPADPAIVHAAFYCHPVNSAYDDVNYLRLHLDSGAVTGMSGNVLGDLDTVGGPAVDPAALDVAISPSAGWRVRIFDLGFVQGRPAIPFAVWDADPNPAALANYRVKVWTGTAWVTDSWQVPSGPEFGYTPAVHYLGGLALSTSGMLLSSRKDAATGDWVVEQWAFDGSTFTLVSEVDRSQTRLIRPRAVEGPGIARMVYQRVPVWATFADWESDLLLR
jgi:hypothetical protein